MSRIYVEFSGLSRIDNECKKISSKVYDIRSEFQNTVRQLDWDIRFQSNINSTANQISKNLAQYSKALSAYQRFISDARDKYVQLDEYKKINIEEYISAASSTFDFNRSSPDDLKEKYNLEWKELIEAFGDAGSVVAITISALGAKSGKDWSKVGKDVVKTTASIINDYNHYSRIGRAIGTANSNGNFLRNFFGFNKVGRASTASSASARFYNNLHNKTSPYKLGDMLDSFKGKNGVVSSVASWAGVVLSGLSNAFSNIEEQKESNGAMSSGRVFAETITETGIDMAVSYGGSAVIGAAIATATGAIATPVVVAVATGAIWSVINTGCDAVFHVSATEVISDLALDTMSAVGNAVTHGVEAVASWFSKL